MSTVYRWMKCLGFKYEVQKKGYYVDGHRKPSTIEYCKHFHDILPMIAGLITGYRLMQRKALK
jgi:hypothetical protein